MTPGELRALALPGDTPAARLESLEKKLAADRAAGFRPPAAGEVNNHIHSIYSFSPYAPAEAAYGAWRAGLDAAGIIDHESLSGCPEMLEAGERIGIAVTSGCELRADARHTPLAGRRINNPDSKGLLYMVLHGIPAPGRPEAECFLAPIRESRNRRMREQVNTLNPILTQARLPPIDFSTEVVPASRSREGGSITERHILYALAAKLENRDGRGRPLIAAVARLGITPPPPLAEKLSDPANPHFLYDLLGTFKASLVPRFYREPESAECPGVREACALAEHVGAIPCYPYLGDVGESPTGDKSAERYEDEWLDELFDALPNLGFRAVTYMPPRNTPEQLTRIKAKCDEKNLMEISGVDINSSRQSFRCPEVTLPRFAHLNRNTWALIAHEHLASRGGPGLFDPRSPIAAEPLSTRLAAYARAGRALNPARTESILETARREGL